MSGWTKLFVGLGLVVASVAGWFGRVAWEAQFDAEWATILVTLVEAVAWPTVAVVVFYGLKDPLINLFPYLEEISGMGLKARFREGVERAARIDAGIEASAPGEAEGSSIAAADSIDWLFEGDSRATLAQAVAPTSPWAQAMALIDVSPNAAVLQSWILLEAEVHRLASRRGVISTKRPPTLALAKLGVLSDDDFAVVEELRNLRNTVRHQPVKEIDAPDARRYVRLARGLALRLGKEAAQEQTS